MQSGNTLNYVTLNQTEFYPVIQASFLVNEKINFSHKMSKKDLNKNLYFYYFIGETFYQNL